MSNIIEARITWPDIKNVKTRWFDMNKLTHDINTNPTDFDLISKGEFYDVFMKTVELDKDHIAYIILPSSYFDYMSDSVEDSKSSIGEELSNRIELLSKEIGSLKSELNNLKTAINLEKQTAITYPNRADKVFYPFRVGEPFLPTHPGHPGVKATIT